MRRLRRLFARLATGTLGCCAVAAGAVDYPPVVPGVPVTLPADHGSHPDFRIEWWYVTGWLDTDDGEALGFQVTFFRTRPDVPPGNPSAFAPRQLVIAHAALSDPAFGRLRHDQRIARATHGLAGADTADTGVWLGDWRLARDGDRYLARVVAGDFDLDLVMTRSQPPMLNGEAGYSRKGADPASASYYYSVPRLEVQGSVSREGRRVAVRGAAWLDHEWSSRLLEPAAAGWDWVGINLDDGSALMAFRMRDRDGQPLWAAATLRRPGGEPVHYPPGDVGFVATRHWTSPRTGIGYPVAFRVRAGPMQLDVEPLLDDQESDSRLTTGAVYWEGAVRARLRGAPVGRGYLELTGYGAPLALPGSEAGVRPPR
jgi:predicted secreted hydrolase